MDMIVTWRQHDTRCGSCSGWHGSCCAALLILLLLALSACTSKQRLAPTHLVAEGSYTRARLAVADSMTLARSDRQYLLDRMKLSVLTLDDGYPAQAQGLLDETYDILRTQGINRDKTVSSVVVNEDLKFWKGEPFEQALTFTYYAMQQAMLGQWDNARAAAGNSLFNLRDFGEDESGQRIDTLGIMRRALEAERTARGDQREAEEDAYLNSGYAVRESNFVMGYLLRGIAAQQMGRDQEANDHYAVAVEVNPTVRPLTDQLRAGAYNTLLVVAYGLGPKKIAYGPDNTLSRFAPRIASDDAPLEVFVNGAHASSSGVVTDVNRMAMDHMWNNLEDVRKAKSLVGNVLLIGGGAATAYGISEGDDIATYAGLGAMALGLIAKAGAHADTRYCEVFPQRFYIVPLQIASPGSVIQLQVRGKPGSQMLLSGMAPPSTHEAQLRYVRLNTMVSPPAWANSGRVFYGNDRTGALDEGNWPYVLGGRDVRTPSPTVVSSYHAHGYLPGMTVAELAELYRAEGVNLGLPDTPPHPVVHVLEGGSSLQSPLVGTAGFARLFGQLHPPYEPRSKPVREIAARLRANPPHR